MTSGPPCFWIRIALGITPPGRKRLSYENREHTGVAVEPVVRDLAVAEESHHGEIAELPADQLQLRRFLAEHLRAAAYARIVQAALRRPVQLGAQPAQHAQQVLARRIAVAPAEHDAHALLDRRPDREQLVPRIDRDDVARQVVARVRPGHRKPDEHEPRRPAQVARELAADLLA